VGVANFFDQSIGIDETNTFQLKFFTKHENCRSHSFGRFLGRKRGRGTWLKQTCLALIVSEISAFIQTDRRTEGHG